MDMLLRRLAFAVGLVCAVIGAQAPEFGQQYRQRLAGAIDELTRVVATFDAEAARENLTPDAAIQRLEANADTLARERGRDLADDKARLDRLRDALQALREGGPARRAFTFVETFDAPTARAAWSDFEPAVPTTYEGFVIAAIAWVLGWGATHIVVAPARRRFGRRAPNRASQRA